MTVSATYGLPDHERDGGETAKLRITISRVHPRPGACSAVRVPAGSGCMRDCTPEPCAQVRIYWGCQNRIHSLTWANVRHGPHLPYRPRPAAGPASPVPCLTGRTDKEAVTRSHAGSHPRERPPAPGGQVRISMLTAPGRRRSVHSPGLASGAMPAVAIRSWSWWRPAMPSLG
jgi:hypothetical protein